MKTPPSERRRAPRQPVQGDLHLHQAGVIAAPLVGHLVDLSDTGFRIRHSRLTLTSGDVVDFELDGQSRAAQAVWTRIVGSEAETGFRILPQDG
jgi:hypothetical protein